MKYSEQNKPMVCMQTQSACYKGTTKMDVKGVLWHSTAANNPNLKRYVQPSDNAADREYWLQLLGKNAYNNDWNHISHNAGMNCWIGKLADGTVTTVQTMPWDYKPWGCGSGSKGSCNNGWVQFEICEDSTNNKDYFDKIYKEACEITAYICDMYNLDPHGTVTYNGVKVPVILCHYDSHNLGLGSNHGDVYHWFNKYGKTMDDVRDDVAKLMKKTEGSSSSGTESATYNVGDIVNFAGGTSYSSSDAVRGYAAKASKAKITVKADKAQHPYHIRAVNDNGAFISGVWGWVDTSTVSAVKQDVAVADKNVADIKVGDVIKLVDGAKYTTGASIPSWVFGKTLYARELQGDNVVFSTLKTGAITGVVNKKYIVGNVVEEEKKEEFKPYIVRVTADVLNIRAGAGTNYAIKGTITDHGAYTIVEEKNGFGRLKSGAGWIYLDYTKKI